MKPGICRKSGGFTLVEIAMVLMIIGLLLGGLLPTISSQIEQQQRNKTRKQMDEIRDALIGFTLINGRLPCPADGTTDSNNSGNESTAGSGVALTCTLTKGVLPWKALGTDEADGWNRRFTYRVTANYADGADGTAASCSITTGVSFQICSSANLNVLSTSGGSTVAANVPAVVVSHGNNGLGAYPFNGGTQIGTATGDESENADDDNTFVSKEHVQNGYDDLVIWVSPNTLVNRMVSAGRLP